MTASDQEEPEQYGDEDDDDRCEACDGLGDDKWCDGLLPCPQCGGSGRSFGLWGESMNRTPAGMSEPAPSFYPAVPPSEEKK